MKTYRISIKYERFEAVGYVKAENENSEIIKKKIKELKKIGGRNIEKILIEEIKEKNYEETEFRL